MRPCFMDKHNTGVRASLAARGSGGAAGVLEEGSLSFLARIPPLFGDLRNRLGSWNSDSQRQLVGHPGKRLLEYVGIWPDSKGLFWWVLNGFLLIYQRGVSDTTEGVSYTARGRVGITNVTFLRQIPKPAERQDRVITGEV